MLTSGNLKRKEEKGREKVKKKRKGRKVCPSWALGAWACGAGPLRVVSGCVRSLGAREAGSRDAGENCP